MEKTVKKIVRNRLWMITLMLVFITGCGSNATTSSGGSTTPSTETTQTTTPSVEEETSSVDAKSTFSIGEQIVIETSKGEYKLTITGITETDDRNQFSDKQADRVVIIDYAYENVSQEDDLYISDMSFKAYDANGTALSTYPATIEYPQSVGIGRNTSAQMAFALNNETNEIELEYYDNMFSSKSDALIMLTW
ncbi:MAG: DUF4352 domain-containing protein [Culicoidibacterales bacterium]